MTAYKTFAVVGGDLRQAHVANRLAAQGKTVYAMLLETNSALEKSLVCAEDPEDVLPQCDVIIFPLPMSTDERHVNAPFSKQKVRVCDCLSGLKPGACVLGGKVSPAMRALAESCGVTIIDYFEREELCVKNAVITAEGAASIAMEELPISLFGSRCMITGHGRISKALMRILRGMGADVTVAARKHGDLAEIEAEGCRAVHIATLAEHVRGMDVLFNTVPARILTADILEKLGPDTLLIDLASKPGGVGRDVCTNAQTPGTPGFAGRAGPPAPVPKDGSRRFWKGWSARDHGSGGKGPIRARGRDAGKGCVNKADDGSIYK